jgi:sugar phosphate permease
MISQRVGRFRGTRLLMTGALINGVAFALFAVMDVVPTWMVVPGLFLAMAVLTFAETLWAPSADALSVELAREHMRGRYLAVYQLSWTFGQVTAPVVFAYLFTRRPVMPLFS